MVMVKFPTARTQPVILLQKWATGLGNSLKSDARYILSSLAKNFNCYRIITNLKREWKIPFV